MQKPFYLLLLGVLFSAFTFLPNTIELVRAGVTDTVNLNGQSAIKYSEDVLFKIHGKELSCNLAVYYNRKKLEASEHVVFKASPDLTILAEEFTYDERKNIGHFSAKVQVKSAQTTSYATLDYDFKTNRIITPAN